MDSHFEKLVEKFKGEYWDKLLTLGELIELAEAEGVSFSRLVAAEAVARQGKTYQEILAETIKAFEHNFRGLEVGLTRGRSFLLGTVGTDLNRYKEKVLIDDALINRAQIYTLATEVGNHEIGL